MAAASCGSGGGGRRPHLGPTIVEFPTFTPLRAWYDSSEYAPLKALRQQHMRFDVMLVDGLSDDEIADNLRQVGLSWTAAHTSPSSAPTLSDPAGMP